MRRIQLLALSVVVVSGVAHAQGAGSGYPGAVPLEPEQGALTPSGPGGYIGNSSGGYYPGSAPTPRKSTPAGININNWNSSGAAALSSPAQTATSQSETIVRQPVAKIEASPLTESRADQLRKSRQGVEIETEQKIVEKLESARIDDEKRRAERLFGDRYNSHDRDENTQQYNNALPPQQPTVQQLPPQAVVLPPPAPAAEIDKEFVKSEIDSAVGTLRAEQEEKERAAKAKNNSSYVGGLIGMSAYPGTNNVRGQYALGVSLANRYKNRLVTEFSFLYSSFELEKANRGILDLSTGEVIPEITSIDQYAGTLGIKYQMLSGMVRPVVGGLAGYTYRNYTDTQYAGHKGYSASTQAFDWGATVGVDVEFDEDYSVGAEYRYMGNLSSQVDSGVKRSFSRRLNQTKPLEEMNYYVVGLSLKAQF